MGNKKVFNRGIDIEMVSLGQGLVRHLSKVLSK